MKARVNRIDMFFEDRGQGLPVLLIHGFPLDHSMWEPQIAALSGRFRFIVPDLRGFGRSEHSDGLDTMDLFAEDMAALLDHLKIDTAVVGGLSMGGYIALAFARNYPQRLKGLVLADTKAEADTPEGKKAREEFAQAVLKGGPAIAAERMLPKMYTPATLQGNPALVERTRKTMEGASISGLVGALRAMAGRPDSTPLLPRIKVPALVIVGAQDTLTPPDAARAMAAKLPDAALVEVPGAAHLSTLEQPEAVARALGEFMARLK